jgi:hypothetical protein
LSSVWCPFCLWEFVLIFDFFSFFLVHGEDCVSSLHFGYLHRRSIELIVVTRVSAYAFLGFFPCTVVSLLCLLDTQSFLFYNPHIESLLLKVKFLLGFSALANAWKKFLLAVWL